MVNLKNHLAELRIKAGFTTQTDAANALTISTSMLSQVESGERIPSPYLASRMVEIYHCTYNEIFLPYNFAKSVVS